MRKRLRKKKHLGEFRQFGFSVKCKLRDGLSSDDFDRFVDAFVVEAIERQDLVLGGGGSPTSEWDGIVCRDHRYDSTTEAHREAVAAWLKQRDEVTSFSVLSRGIFGMAPTRLICQRPLDQDDSKAEQGARANVHIRHAACSHV